MSGFEWFLLVVVVIGLPLLIAVVVTLWTLEQARQRHRKNRKPSGAARRPARVRSGAPSLNPTLVGVDAPSGDAVPDGPRDGTPDGHPDGRSGSTPGADAGDGESRHVGSGSESAPDAPSPESSSSSDTSSSS